MKARVFRGSRKEIVQRVAEIDGEISEIIVFVEDLHNEVEANDDVFAEMEPFTVQQSPADDSRDAIYGRLVNE